MCGIAGILFDGSERETVLAVGRAMGQALSHRGPDDAGLECISADGMTIALAHTRLAIIDLSAAGHQPMRDAATGNWIVFNGEIYNFEALREELTQTGHQFETRSDTEVILKAFAQWGGGAWVRLRGIFAVGVWEAARRCLHLVRDPLGVKPLYVWHRRGELAFASEVRALLAGGRVPRTLCYRGLASYLAYGSLQEPFTLVAGVRSLPPGSWLTIDAGMVVTERHYWSIPKGPAPARGGSEAELRHELRGRLLEAVRVQMVADVPVGVFLSGGIDSVALAYLAQQASGTQVRTFSLVFAEEQYDERRFSRAAAARFGTAHTEVEFSVDSVLRSLDDAVGAFDQPSMDGTNTYFVAKSTREAGLKVALSGVGGDELFGGYGGYRKARGLRRLARLRGLPAPLSGLLPAALRVAGRPAQAGRIAELLAGRDDAYYSARRLFLDAEIATLGQPGTATTGTEWTAESRALVEAEIADHDTINQLSILELRGYMTNTLLRDTDQMTMAHALEVRVPLLDPVLVEYLTRLPGNLKLKRGQPKSLLTLPLAGDLPDECVHRRKGNFELPYAVWLKGALAGQVQDVLTDPAGGLHGILQPAAIEALWRHFLDGRVYWTRVWSLYVLARWLSTHGIRA